MYDEMNAGGTVRAPYAQIARWIEEAGLAHLRTKSLDAEALFRRGGITFAVYGDGGDPERLIPFDLVPRVITASEWAKMSKGVIQRARALNLFLKDLYGDAACIREGIIPAELTHGNHAFEARLKGVMPPGDVYSHIVGVDIVRTGPESFFVLEDNCRTPSGVSYMLENREIMMRLFPDLFETIGVQPVDEYPIALRQTLASVAPESAGADPNIAILTPGLMNSAFYEHSFLSDQTGLELVQGPDLYCEDGYVWMRTTLGPQRVDVVYRRIDDDFLDPQFFRPESVLGVPGLIDVYRAGRVAIVSAPGSGVADDKAVYTYLPDLIRFYLSEEPLIDNVETWRCSDPASLSHVLANIGELVIKRVDGSGGYGMLIGPKSTRAEQEAFAEKIKADPDAYIAQPTLSLSTCPSLVAEGVAPRHVDLRPFALVGRDSVRLTPGGLTRVALKNGSLVVNSSQGGGVKDTWVLSDDG